MYQVSAQGVDERMINVHYYYYYLVRLQKCRIQMLYNTGRNSALKVDPGIK